MALDISDVKPILESAYECRREIVPCFIGLPGIGKTEGIEQFAKDAGVKLVTFILSNTIPSEVSGIRMPDKDTKSLEVFDDARMSSLEDGDILFFDEILEAPRELWSACLTLIQSRIMASGRALPDVMIVAASNPLSNPSMIPASVKDRFMMLEVEWNEQRWIRWFENRFGKTPVNGLVENIRRSMKDTSSYNVLTPRRVVKLYQWYSSSDDIGRCAIKHAIISMFDELVANQIQQTFEQKITVSQAVMIELKNLGIDTSEIEGLVLKDMLEVLKAMDEWPEIEKALANARWEE